MPIHALKEKTDQFIAAGDLSFAMGEAIIKTIEDERGKQRLVNQADGNEEEQGRLSNSLNDDELQAELDKRIAMMRSGGPDGEQTDQSRVFDYIISVFESGTSWLRLMVQASAGTGKRSGQVGQELLQQQHVPAQ